MKVCLYHGSDLDGHCCGAIFAKAQEDEEYLLVPVEYGEPLPAGLHLEGADLTIMDWSFQPWSEFDRVLRLAARVTWIDHHKSAIDAFRQSEASGPWCPVRTVLDTTKAACELGWDHFFPGEDTPWGVRLLGRYDVWDHSDPEVLLFQYGMRVLDTDPRSARIDSPWRSVLLTDGSDDTFIGEAIGNGELLLKYQRQNDAAAVSKAWFPVAFAGHKWQACNRLGKGSGFFDAVWDPIQFHGMMAFGWDGTKWIIGLYSDRDDVDCSRIAKENGGGGHLGAAGFQCVQLPFNLPDQETPEELSRARALDV